MSLAQVFGLLIDPYEEEDEAIPMSYEMICAKVAMMRAEKKKREQEDGS